MNEYYVSLVGPLCGYYLKAKAENDSVVRQWASSKLGKMWCSVYKPERLEREPHFDKTKVVGQTVLLSVEDGELYDNYI